METKGCHNCEHQYVNHKRCDLPFGVKCNSGEKWEKRKDVLSIFKKQEKVNIPAVMGELTCDNCGCHPNVIYPTSKGRFCERCKPAS